jgi:hypothetical protein
MGLRRAYSCFSDYETVEFWKHEKARMHEICVALNNSLFKSNVHGLQFNTDKSEYGEKLGD